MAKLGLNVDHIATVRQARGGIEPDPVTAAALGELAGAEASPSICAKTAATSRTVTWRYCGVR